MKTTQYNSISLEVNNLKLDLKLPQNVSRMISFGDSATSSGAFYINQPKSETVEFPGLFIGDIERGGSCNVDYLTFCPHNITHLETSAHILSLESNPPMVSDISQDKLMGLAYLIDLSDKNWDDNDLIQLEDIQATLEALKYPVNMVIIKTHASLLEESYDFSGKNFLAVSEEAAKYLNKYQKNQSVLHALILDLPSIDPENDEGKLLAHRAWFGIPKMGVNHSDQQKKALVELAYFKENEQGYYYVNITPAKLKTNAVSTGISLSHVQNIN